MNEYILVLRPASVCACNCVLKNILNHQPVEPFIYGYSLKRAMKKKLKGLGESIYFWNGLSADTTEEKHRRNDAEMSVEPMLCTTFAYGACCRSKDGT